MLGGGLLYDFLLMGLSYAYILSMILLSNHLGGLLSISRRASRKFLHMMIGNFPFIIPFFSSALAPVIVAAPFILVTYVASPVSPFRGLRKRLGGLADLTEEGHHHGLIFYAISYTLLALLFAEKPHVIAAGILPMAYGDSSACLVGERYGRRRHGLMGDKSLEGSLSMFASSLLVLTISLVFFSYLYGFTLAKKMVPALAVAAVVTVVECFSPKGMDNLTVPLLGALTFLLVDGWL